MKRGYEIKKKKRKKDTMHCKVLHSFFFFFFLRNKHTDKREVRDFNTKTHHNFTQKL